MFRSLVFVVSWILFSGCVTRGQDFTSDVSWIKSGVTSKSEFDRRMGKPFSVGHASGKPTWTYGYYHFQLFGSSFSKELKLYWDDNTLSNFSFETSFPDDVRMKTTL